MPGSFYNPQPGQMYIDPREMNGGLKPGASPMLGGGSLAEAMMKMKMAASGQMGTPAVKAPLEQMTPEYMAQLDAMKAEADRQNMMAAMKAAQPNYDPNLADLTARIEKAKAAADAAHYNVLNDHLAWRGMQKPTPPMYKPMPTPVKKPIDIMPIGKLKKKLPPGRAKLLGQ
jgi:hypothetical protein